MSWFVYIQAESGGSVSYELGSWVSGTVSSGDSRTITGNTDGWSASFTANPASGQQFKRWRYRIGGYSGTLYYSTSNPLTFNSVTQDLVVVAEFETQSSADWSKQSNIDLGTISTEATRAVTLGSYKIQQVHVKFAYTGSVTFKTTGNYDTKGWLASSVLSFSSSTGEPTGTWLEYDDDSGDGYNCAITYYCNSGTDYYFYFRMYDGDDSGSVTCVITPPQASFDWERHDKSQIIVGASAVDNSVSAQFSEGYVWVLPLSFGVKGTCTFYTTRPSGTNLDSYGYVTSSLVAVDASTGAPSGSILASDDDSGENLQCSITLTVEAGHTYYFYVRLYDITNTGTLSLCYSFTPTPTHTVTLQHYKENSLYDTSTVQVSDGDTINLAAWAISITGYTYDHAEDLSGNIITTNPVITAPVTYKLIYVSGTSYKLQVYRNGNCKKVSISYGGNTSVSDESSQPAQLYVPYGGTVTISYTPYTNHTGWYKFYGWFSGTNGTGTCYSREYTFTFTMPNAATVIYGYAVLQSSAFAWTYAKTQGGTFNLTAQEWNDWWDCLQSRLGAAYSHTRAVQGAMFTHGHAMQAMAALGRSMTINKGDPITAAFMNNLVTYVNSL